MFSIMAFLLCWAVHKKYVDAHKLRFAFLMMGFFCLCYGIAMEFVQKYFIPNRSFDVGDIIADGIGSIIGILYSLRRYKKN